MLLALDLSTHTGWAAAEPSDVPRAGVWHLRGDGIGAYGTALQDCLDDLHKLCRFTRVVMEAPLPPGAQTHAATARIQLGLAAAVEMWAYQLSIPCQEASASTVRKAVIGNGRAKKDDVMAWVRRKGWSAIDDNAGDALALWEYARHRGPMQMRSAA
ncbi:Holliday junction resolvase [Rhodovarius lipocyclicus]|uniref:Holliday junction resolvase n=1 Tax=Rhodovarius lipocyclicus TaxID=268410 RepID=UPI00135B47EF|nr:Holliday junction resolvase [Rhodovarius lipocyclicus]